MSDSYTERDIHAQIARLARDLHSYEHSGKTIDTLLLAVTRQAVGMLDEVDHEEAKQELATRAMDATDD